MKTNIKKTKRLCFFKAALLLLLVLCAFLLPSFETNAVKAESRFDDLIRIEAYAVDMTITTDRKVQVKESITVTFLKEYSNGNKITMFYRSLPVESARYYDISAKCEENPDFYYEVADNPDMSGFFDINCIGGVAKGKTYTYDIAFTMENGANAASRDDGMIIDVIPFGFTVDLHNVSATVRFPYAVDETACKTYVGYGSTSDALDTKQLSSDGKTLTFSKDCLSVRWNDAFSENVAQGVTLDFTMNGKFDSYVATRLFTDGLWGLLLGGAVCVGLAVVLLIFTRKKRDMITVVNITAPDNMDPMKMGKLLDGNADNEDITSMIYYFAHKGYLTIDLTDENDPVLTKKIDELPADAPVHQKTLFNGLFKQSTAVSVSALKEKFYEYADRAKMQVSMPNMYEKKSVFGYIAGGILALLFGFLSGWLTGRVRLGGGYDFWDGVSFVFPVVFILLFGFIRENYRYKWKKRTSVLMLVVELIVAAVFSLLYIGVMGRHIFTGWEKAVISLASFACLFITQGALSRTEAYTKTLGEILGFKDFIVVTEEDKIKFMLEQDPELYYKILPYAQVLGVTNEWENKFKNILVQPPQWCTGNSYTVFDYMILNRCMRRAMAVAMTRPQPQGGGSIGRSGGGGSFGGFGGGGFGGGGGGAR